MVSSSLRGGPAASPPSKRGGRSWASVCFFSATTVTAAAWLLFFFPRRDLVADLRRSAKALPRRVLSFEAPSGADDTSGDSIALQQHQQRRHVFSFDAPDGPSAPGVGHGYDHHQQQQLKQRERRPACAESDDPEYSCLVPRPPGSFADELKVYFSLAAGPAAGGDDRQQQQQQQGSLAVKVVVPAVTRQREGGGRGGGGGEARWASLGLSPNGKMAGPSEAVVGCAGAAERGDQGVFRYVMDGYSIASVTRLPHRHQILTEQAVETTADGSLVVRFKRPLLEPPPMHQDACAGAIPGKEGGLGGGPTMTAGDDVAETEAAVCSVAVEAVMEWLDPRDEGNVVILWAYGRAGWPSYHDATGAFVLPRLTPVV